MARRWVAALMVGAVSWLAWPVVPTWPTWLLLAGGAAVVGLAAVLGVVSPLLTYVLWMWLGGVPWERVGVGVEWGVRAGTTVFVVVSLVVAFTPRSDEVEADEGES